MKNIHIYIAFYLICISFSAGAQRTVIRGNVTDGQSGEAMPFVTIAEMDQDNRVVSGTVTDMNGNYTIEVNNPQNQLLVSYIGYKSQTVDMDGRTIINFELSTEAVDFEELVIVAARPSTDPLSMIPDRDRTGATSRVDMQELLSSGSVSADDALQGQISGVDIVTSGDPGAGSSIVIRGLGTLGTATPLIVVDGIPQDIRAAGDFDFSAADQESIGALVNISPQDIRSVEVLKDAASTAVWGSQGANGVLLIETLRGTRGATKFTYQNRYSISVAPPELPLLNGDEYIMLQLEQRHAPSGIFNAPPELSNDRTILGKDYYNYTQNTNWLNYFTQLGVINDHYFKVSGGGQRTNYFGSVNYVDEKGTTIHTGLKRIAARTNLDYRVSNKLSFSSNISYSNTYREDNYRYRTNETVRDMAIKKAPNMSIWEYNENGFLTGDYFTPIRSYQGSGTAYYNPVAMAELGSNDTEQNSVITSFNLRYSILPWLTFQEVISFTYVNSKRKQFLPYNALGEDWLFRNMNRADETNSATTRLLTRTQLFINPRWQGDHSISSSLMFETREENSYYVSLATSQSASALATDPATGSVFLSSNSGQSATKAIGGLMQLFYKFKDNYMVTANLRFDGSSKFGLASRYGVFPSISGGWRFSEEPWAKALPFLGESRVRLSYGFAGNDRGNELGVYDRHSAYGLAGFLPPAYIDNSLVVPLRIQLDKLKWETISQWNAGLDLRLFQRLNMTFDLYEKLTSDILWKNYTLPTSSGYPTLFWYNGGKLLNQGWELSVDYRIVQRSELTFRLRGNISRNINKYLEFPENFNNEVSTALGNNQYPRRAEIGQPVGSFYGLTWLGVWPDDQSVSVYDANGEVVTDLLGNPVPMIYQTGYIFQGGDARYDDKNHDGVIDLNDVVYLGNANPKFEGGFGGTLNYRRSLQFTFFLHARVGHSIVNMIAAETQGMNDYNNQSKAVLSRWRKPGDSYPGILPRAYFGNPVNNLGSNRFVEDGSYLRFNNVTLTYNIPEKYSRRIGAEQIDIALTARKLYTWTNYTGQDPEILSKNDPFWMGADTGETPVPMRITMSLTVNF